MEPYCPSMARSFSFWADIPALFFFLTARKSPVAGVNFRGAGMAKPTPTFSLKLDNVNKGLLP